MARRTLTIFVIFCLSAWAARGQEETSGEPTDAPSLKVWLPAPLISDESGAAFQLLRGHTANFTENNNIAVDFRIKDIGAPGGIIATIRAGKDVAPGALPDVTLIRKRDFTQTLASQYFQSLETLFSSSLINDLDNELELGQIPLGDDVALYGLPYLVDLLLALHTVPLEDDSRRLRFQDILDSGAVFMFPAGRANGLNQTFYMQYLSASGSSSSDGLLAIDEDALGAVLRFYADLLEAGLISPDVLTYQSPNAYMTDFINRASDPQAAVFNVSAYLAMLDQQDAGAQAAGIPTPSGESASIRDGWLWVIVTPDSSRIALAARFLEWMMEPGFHASFAGALYHLPTQPAVLEASLPATVDRQFIQDLLSSATSPLPEGEGGTAPRLMQEALVDVLHGDATAAEATKRVLSQYAER